MNDDNNKSQLLLNENNKNKPIVKSSIFKRSNTMGKGKNKRSSNDTSKQGNILLSTPNEVNNNLFSPFKSNNAGKIGVNTTTKKSKKDKKAVTFNKEFIEYVDISRHVKSQDEISHKYLPKNASIIEIIEVDKEEKGIRTLEDKSGSRLTCCCLIF